MKFRCVLFYFNYSGYLGRRITLISSAKIIRIIKINKAHLNCKLMFFTKFLYPRKRLVDWKLFSVEGPARLRDLDGRIAVSVRLGVWPRRLTGRIEPLSLSDGVEFFPTYVIRYAGHIWRSVFSSSSPITKLTIYVLMLYNFFIQVLSLSFVLKTTYM